MRDPHVEELRYRVFSDPGTTYQPAADLKCRDPLGELRLASGVLTVSPTQHYSTVEEARAKIGPFLKAWEIYADLTEPEVGTIHFEPIGATIIDRNPLLPGSRQAVDARATITGGGTGQATAEVVKAHYPQPPAAFNTSPNLETLHHRFLGFRNGKEPLLAFAYFVLSMLEWMADTRDKRNKRKNAAKHFQISKDTLDCVGHLSSERGSSATARKMTHKEQGAVGGELTPDEEEWLRKTVQQMIRRVGEVAGGAKVSEITLRSLPWLNSPRTRRRSLRTSFDR